MSSKLDKLLNERRELLNNIKKNEDLLETTLIRVNNFDERYNNQKKITYTGKKVTEKEILQNVDDIKTNIPMYRDLITLYTRQNEDLTPLINKEKHKINNETKKSEQNYSNLRKEYIDHRVITDNLSSGLEELRQTANASAINSNSTNSSTFFGRLAQRFTGKNKLPDNVKNEGKSIEDQLEEMPNELNTILEEEFKNKNITGKSSRINYDEVQKAVDELTEESFAGGKRKRKTNKRKYSNKRKKYSKKNRSNKRKLSRRK